MDSRRFYRKPELLAPAGDLARLKTAVLYGADAVYIGGRSFSLRSRASNFTMDDIREACAFAKEHGAAVHVTVNIIPHENDFAGLEEYLQKLQEAGVHAVIAASAAVMKAARRAAPGLEVHCSTQMSVTNSDAAKLLYETIGIDRVVLARECTMDEVKKIASAIPCETEAFIHGGMCVNYSGRCTLSNRMTLRDANRGGCAQSCRWQYRVFENRETRIDNEPFTMGSKDLMAAEHIRDLMEACVSSFKIEGRMKTEYYIACVVSAYRRLIDELYENPDLCEERMAWHVRQIMRGENRAVWGGFYEHPGDRDSLITKANSDADVNHDFLGKIVSVKDGRGVIEVRNVFASGERAEILSPRRENQPFVFGKLKTEAGEYKEQARHPMEHLETDVPAGTLPGDIVRRAE